MGVQLEITEKFGLRDRFCLADLADSLLEDSYSERFVAGNRKAMVSGSIRDEDHVAAYLVHLPIAPVAA
jgi:hypothetical protein